MYALITLVRTTKYPNYVEQTSKRIWSSTDLVSLIFVHMYDLMEEDRTTFYISRSAQEMAELRKEAVQLCRIQLFQNGVRIPHMTRLSLLRQREEVTEALCTFFFPTHPAPSMLKQ